MILTNYEHACFTVEQDNKLVVVDPGAFTSDFIPSDNIIGVVITHEHGDHFDHELLEAIIDKNPDAIIYAHPSVTSTLEVFSVKAVLAGDHESVGPFELAFFGGEHAVIHEDLPVVANLGVLINDLIYFPGDSFVQPERPIDTLALPVSAPWLKLREAADFARAVKPRLVFPTHDHILSDVGKSLVDNMLPPLLKDYDITYERLTKPIEI